MTRALIVSGLVIAVAGCTSRTPAASRAELAASEAVKVLRADDSPYRIIYFPPEDLAKKPAAAPPTTSGPASRRRR
jgi:hypothetical protein